MWKIKICNLKINSCFIFKFLRDKLKLINLHKVNRYKIYISNLI